MPEPSVVHNTFVIERNYPHSMERVFAAFADPALKRGWYAPDDQQEDESFDLDFRVGGTERLVYRFRPGAPVSGVITNQGVIQDIVPGQRVVTAYTMALGDARISSSLVTIELVPANGGTDLICTHQGAFFEGSDGPARRQEGWRVLLEKLGKALAP